MPYFPADGDHDSGDALMAKALGEVLKAARESRGLSLRKVEAQTGIRNAHLSQIENGTIVQPEMAMLWELASLYELEYRRLLKLAGYDAGPETSGRQRQRMTVALRAMEELTPKQQTEVLSYMRSLKGKPPGD
jgi:transcriptional regulator with XRE-family HTH domain